MSPANGATELYNDVQLTWNPIGSWGNGCPTSPSYRLRMVQTATTCPAAPYPVIIATGSTNATINDLNWGATYCWYIESFNGSRSTNSAIRYFNTAIRPTLTGSGISSAQVCGNGISGSANITGTDNPITYYTEYSISGAPITQLREVVIGIVPNTVRNGSPISETSLTSASADYFAAMVTINHSNLSQSQFKIVNTSSSPYYSSNTTSGNLTNSNNKASLLNINGAGGDNTRVVQVNANTIRVYWQIRFEDGYGRASTANVYSGAFRQLPTGQWNSSTGSNSIDRSVAILSTWRINTQPAQVSIGTPNPLNATDFELSWNYLDGFEVTNVRGYMWTGQNPISLQRLNPAPTTLSIPSAEPGDNTPTNVNVHIASLGVHRYRLPDTVDESDTLNTKMRITDSACNVVVDSGTGLGISSGWIVTAHGDTFAPNFDIDIQNVDLDPPITGLDGYSYLSTYTASVGEPTLGVATRTSKKNFVLEGYNDANSQPPKTSDKTSWYDYMHELVTKNSQVTTISLSQIADGTKTHSAFGTAAYTTKHVLINGDLTIGKNVKCNTKSIIFISGNLTLNPDFMIENNGSTPMACMFVAKGNTTVDKGHTQVVAPTPPPPPVGVNGATFVSQSVPSFMTPGQVYQVSVTMLNSGTKNWTASTQHRLGSQNPQDNTTWGIGRVSLAPGEVVAPGQTKTFTFNVVAPSVNNIYYFQWRMLQEGVEWFGDYSLNTPIYVFGWFGASPTLGATTSPQGTTGTTNKVLGLTTTDDKNPYDVIEAFIITDGSFTTAVDTGDGSKYEGLYINGSVISKTNDFGRDLRVLNNAKQPSEVIEFDPRYSILFAEEFEIKDFSIRERDYLIRTVE